MADAAESSNVLPHPTTSDGDATSATTTDVVGASCNDTVNENAAALSSLALAAEQDPVSTQPPAATDNGIAPSAAVVVSAEQQIDVEDGEEEENNDDDDDGDDGDVEAYLPHDEFLSLLPPVVLPRIAHLKTLNDTRDVILEEYRIERAALELKYAAKMEPLYEERRRVVNGESLIEDVREKEKQDAGVPDGEDNEGRKAEREGGADDDDDDDIKGIPQFWACAMGNVDVIAEMITEGKGGCGKKKIFASHACRWTQRGTVLYFVLIRRFYIKLV